MSGRDETEAMDRAVKKFGVPAEEITLTQGTLACADICITLREEEIQMIILARAAIVSFGAPERP